MLRRAFVLLVGTVSLAGCGGGQYGYGGNGVGYGGLPVRLAGAQPGGPPGAAGFGGQRVAILLPLSGPHADIGQPMLQAAQLAMDAQGGPPIDAKDTGGTPDGAAAAARAAIADGAGLSGVRPPWPKPPPSHRWRGRPMSRFWHSPTIRRRRSQASGRWHHAGPTGAASGRGGAGPGEDAIRRAAARHGLRPCHGAGADPGDRGQWRATSQHPFLCIRHAGHQCGGAGLVRLRQPARPD